MEVEVRSHDAGTRKALGEKVLEYKMTDEKLKEINIANFFGEAKQSVQIKLEESKLADWDRRLKNYM